MASLESLEPRAMLAFTALPASGNQGGAAINLSSDTANPNHELTIILDDQSNPTFVTATITTFDGTTTKTGQFFNFSKISYAASNDTDGSVVNTVKLWTSYEADLAGYENAPSDKSQVGLATSWRVDSRFPAGAATTSPLLMENVDALVVTSGVIGGGASTIAGEFESPTLAPLTAATAAKVTLNSGTRVTGANIGGTAALDPIVVYSLAITTQTGDVNLATDVFTVDDLSITAAKNVTLTGLVQVEEGDITIASTSGNLALGEATFFAHALEGAVTLTSECGTVSVQKVCAATDVTLVGELGVTVGGVIDAGDDITITAENGPVTVADLLAGGKVDVDPNAIDIDAGKAITINGLVRASTGNIAITSVSDAINVSDAAKVHAVAGGIDIAATRGPAALQNLFAEESIAVDALGDVALKSTIQTTSGDFVVNSDGNIDNSARLLIGGSLKLDSGLNVSSLGGGIVRLELLSSGTNYEYAIVTIAPPAAGGGRAALARATVTGGEVTGLTIVDPGYGYAPNEQAAVAIEGNDTGAGAQATAFAGSTLSSMQAGQDLEITAGTAVDITNELRAENGKVTVAVSSGPLSLSDIFAGDEVSLTAAQTIDLGGLVRTAKGDVSVESAGGGVDVGATLLAPAGGATVTAAGQIVQRGGSVSRDKLFLLSGGRDYTYALVVVDPPPGAGQAALARAVITYYNPFDLTEGGFISDIVLLDPGWGYPSDSRVNVSIQGDGEGATAVFATGIVTSSIDVRDDVKVQAGDAITLVSSVRSSEGIVTLRNTTGDLAVQSVTSKLAADVESERGKVTLVSVAAGGNVDIAAFRGVSVTDSVNTTAGDIAITTTDGDLQFVQGFDFGDNYLVNADATALQPLAVIATAAGGIELRSDNGSITTPFVVNGTDDVTITSFGLLEATNEITSTKGDVVLRSTSGLVQLEANVAAVSGSITIAAHTQLNQQVMSGVSTIQLLSPGEVVPDTAPQVTVTVAAPRNGGTAATAVAIIERRSTGDGDGVDDEYFLGAIAIIDAGQGYAVGEQPIVTITGINGASARAFGPLNAAMLTAGDGITLSAGEDLTLVTKVHATTGNVVVGSAAGNIDLADQSLLLSAADGAISVDAPRGTVVVQRAAATEDVTINGLGGIEILGSVVSEDGGITLKALDGAVDARQVNAAGDVTITSFKSGTLAGEIASSAGTVSFTSLAGGLFLEANIVAAGSVDIDAQTFILQDGRSGVERIDVINGGSTTGDTPPTVTVTVAEPAAGGVAARAQAVIGQRSATEYFIESIFIIDPGTGYARGEVAEVEITGMSGAVARAFGPTNLRNVTAGSGVTLDAGDDITLVNAVTATTGDILVASVSGNVGMGVSSALLNAVAGSVTVKADAGAAMVNAVYAGTDITIDVAEQVALFGVLESDEGDVEVKSWKRDVDLTPSGARIAVDVGSATLTALNGSVLTPPVLQAKGDVTIRGLTTIGLRNEVTSATGTITVESVSGGIELTGNLNAVAGAIDLEAHGAVTQGVGGVSYVEVLTGGTGYDASATVTIAAPFGGGRAATGRLVLGTVGGVAGVIIGITVVDPGVGYAVGENPTVTIAGAGTGGTARAVVVSGPQNIVAGTDVTVAAGTDVLLVNTVTANKGDIAIDSTSGDIVTGRINSVAGGVTLAANVGVVTGTAIRAAKDVAVTAESVLLDTVVSSAGGVDVTGATNFTLVQGKRDVNVAGDFAATTVRSSAGNVTVLGAQALSSVFAGQIADVSGVSIGSVEAGTDAIVRGTQNVGSVTAGQDATVTAPTVSNVSAGRDAKVSGADVRNVEAVRDVGIRNTGDMTASGLVRSETGDVSILSDAGSVTLWARVVAEIGMVTVEAQTGVTQVESTGLTSIDVFLAGSVTSATVPVVTVTVAAPAAVGGRAATAEAILQTSLDAFGNTVYSLERIVLIDRGAGYAAGESPAVTITGLVGAAAVAVGPLAAQSLWAGDGILIAAGEDVTLTRTVTATAGDVSVTSKSGSVTFSGNSVTAADTISIEARGVAGTSPSLVSERFEFRGLGPAAVNFNGANSVRELFVSSKGGFAFQNNGDLALTDGLSTASVQATTQGDLTVNVANGTLRVVDGITHGGALRLSANDSPLGVQFVTTANTDSLLSGFTGSLRNMIGYVNANAARSTMSLVFDESGSPIEASGVIAVAAALPGIANAVRFDGSLANGTIVGLDGSLVAAANAVGLTLVNGSSGSVVQDAAVYGFRAAGVQLSSAANIVRGMNVGLDRSGKSAAANGVGIEVVGINASGNVIGAAGIGDVGNVIGNSEVAGIRVRAGATATLIYGNKIGGQDGSPSAVPVGGTLDGIAVLNSSGTVIGGAAPGQANSIVGNGRFGVFISNVNAASPAQGTRIVANSITANGNSGVAIVGGSGVTVGGTVAGVGNTITGNRDGVVLRSSSTASSFNNAVTGNTIEANGRDGVRLEGGYGSQINANTIEGSVLSGVRIAGAVASIGQPAHRVFNNMISKSGTNALNGGIVLEGASGQLVGQSTDGAWVGNTLAENTGSGIVVLGGTTGSEAQGNVVRGNRVTQSSFNGILVQRSSANVIQRNSVSDNRSDGIALVDAIAPTVDKGNVAIGNTVSGNDGAGIRVRGGSRALIGGATAALGNTVFANDGDGIVVESSPGTGAALGVAVRGNVVGIDSNGAGAGNQGFGVTVSGGESTTIAFRNIVRNNLLGGIQVVGGRATTIGGPIAGRGNVISGNFGAGGVIVGRVGARTQSVTIAGNTIESNSQGYGVQVVGPTTSGVVVGRSPSITQPNDSGNTIADNQNGGVRVDGAQAVTIIGNSFANNGGLPIELANGGNGSIPAATLTMARAVVANQKTPRYDVRGTVAGTPGQRFFVDLYGNRPADGTQFYLGRVTVTVAASGIGSFRRFVNGGVGGASEVVATATLASTLVSGTSQFSVEIPTT